MIYNTKVGQICSLNQKEFFFFDFICPKEGRASLRFIIQKWDFLVRKSFPYLSTTFMKRVIS